jgi:hypothetical protein
MNHGSHHESQSRHVEATKRVVYIETYSNSKDVETERMIQVVLGTLVSAARLLGRD